MKFLQHGLSTIVFALTFSNVMAQVDVKVEDLMTPSELRETGVDSLSPAQKKALTTWLIKFRESDIDLDQADLASSAEAIEKPEQLMPASQANPSQVDDPWRSRPEKVDFVTKIVGEFSGWEGRTQFNLENGQVWVQRRSSRWKTELTNPEVRIYQNFLGAYEMEVIEANRSIGVRRIR